MIYEWYFEGNGKFSKHNSLGAQIGQDVKNCDENREKKMMTINTGKTAKKKKTMNINNSILYDILVNRASAKRNPLRMKFERISKLVPPGSTFSKDNF